MKLTDRYAGVGAAGNVNTKTEVDVTLQRAASIGSAEGGVHVASQGPRAKKLPPVTVRVDARAANAGKMPVTNGAGTVETRNVAGVLYPANKTRETG
jgi:hypothetical protein